MDREVLDASAILAAIGNEPGADLVFEHISHAAVSTVNLAEVQSKLIERGFPPNEAWESALSFVREVFVLMLSKRVRLADSSRSRVPLVYLWEIALVSL